MIWLFYIAVSFLVVRICIALINLISGNNLKEMASGNEGKVSILIPARNESARIKPLLESIARQTYRDMEVIVYDDDSIDDTAEVVKAFAGKLPSLKIINGGKLPLGWGGKNHACYQLGREATGKYFLFLDADVVLNKYAVSKIIARLIKNRSALISVFPVQTMKSLDEWVTVPLMDHILLSLLPLSLVKNTSIPALSAANGQFMCFDGEKYLNNQWHYLVKNKIAEDIKIMKILKKKGYKGEVRIGAGIAKCRMYENYLEAIRGFSKNIFFIFGGSYYSFTLLVFLLVINNLILFNYFPFTGIVEILVLLPVLRIITSLAARQNILYNLMLFPFQKVSLFIICVMGFYQKISGQIIWKGRKAIG